MKQNKEDKWSWKESKDGNYTMKTSYLALMNMSEGSAGTSAKVEFKWV